MPKETDYYPRGERWRPCEVKDNYYMIVWIYTVCGCMLDEDWIDDDE